MKHLRAAVCSRGVGTTVRVCVQETHSRTARRENRKRKKEQILHLDLTFGYAKQLRLNVPVLSECGAAPPAAGRGHAHVQTVHAHMLYMHNFYNEVLNAEKT